MTCVDVDGHVTIEDYTQNDSNDLGIHDRYIVSYGCHRSLYRGAVCGLAPTTGD